MGAITVEPKGRPIREQAELIIECIHSESAEPIRPWLGICRSGAGMPTSPMIMNWTNSNLGPVTWHFCDCSRYRIRSHWSYHTWISISGYLINNTAHTTQRDIQHNDTTQQHNNTTQRHNDNTIPLIVIFTYKTMAEVLGAVASAMAVVEVAGKVWSTGWKYYQVRIPPKQFEPQSCSVVNNFIWG